MLDTSWLDDDPIKTKAKPKSISKPNPPSSTTATDIKEKVNSGGKKKGAIEKRVLPEPASLDFPEVIGMLRKYSRNSGLDEYKELFKCLTKGNSPNYSFQGKRLKDLIRMMLDSGMKIMEKK